MDKGFHSPVNQRALADIKGATALAHRLASGAEVNRIGRTPPTSVFAR